MTHKHSRHPHHKTSFPSSTEPLPPLPLEPELWKAVARAMQLSDQLSLAVELLLRGLANKQIAREMHIEECTLDSYFTRIGARTGAYGRTEIFRHVLKVSHELRDQGQVP